MLPATQFIGVKIFISETNGFIIVSNAFALQNGIRPVVH